LLFLFYLLLLRRDTFYGAKRLFLLCIVFFSIALPLIHLAGLIPQKQSIRYIVVLINNSMPYASHAAPVGLSLSQWVDLVLLVGMVLTVIILVFRYLQLYKTIRGCRSFIVFGQTVFIPGKEVNPFSFNGRIYLNPELYDAGELYKIVEHERAHIVQRHGVDLLLVSFFRIFVWMNPLYYLFANAVRENVEFLADQKVLKAGNDPREYQYALLKVAQTSALPMTQHFSISHLKKRIIMMNKKRTHTVWSGKYLLTIPLFIAAVLLVNASELKDAWVNADFTAGSNNTSSGAAADSVRKEKTQVVVICSKGDSASTHPLILVDGKVVPQSELDSINPALINSINVLKGDSAVYRFGKDGKNGVIIIKMKKDKESSKAAGNSSVIILNGNNMPSFDMDNFKIDKEAMDKMMAEWKDKFGDADFLKINSEKQRKLMKEWGEKYGKQLKKQMEKLQKDGGDNFRNLQQFMVKFDAKDMQKLQEELQKDFAAVDLKDFAALSSIGDSINGQNMIIMTDKDGSTVVKETKIKKQTKSSNQK
jgi:hypothetical protein